MRDYDGIKADINRMTGPAFREWWVRFAETTQGDKRDNGAALDLSGELAQAIITAWPFEGEISKESYLRLGVLDMDDVDHALEQEIALVIKKKSERRSISVDGTSAI